jgi:hypothetical protein
MSMNGLEKETNFHRGAPTVQGFMDDELADENGQFNV